MAGIRVGVIGGTGLGEALKAMGRGRGESHFVETPFGPPAGPITLTEVDGTPVALLARHGPGHLLSPTRVPYRANIFALKALGVTHVLASGVVGSLREHIAPRHLVIPDQVIDRTYRRPPTFYDDIAAHVEMAMPFCGTLREVLASAAQGADSPVHPSGTYVCVEGPARSTRAESLLYRAWGGDLTGMTAMPEAKLAREAELHYALVALPTDYDCWLPSPPDHEPDVLMGDIFKQIQAVTASGLALIRRALPRIAAAPVSCRCDSALAAGIWSERGRIPNEVRTRLRPLLGKYLPPEIV